MELTKTRIQLANEAGGKLLIVASGQELEPEDFDKIDGKIDPLIMQLSVDEICEVNDDDAIPSEWFDAIAGLLANVSGPDFGKPFSPEQKQYYESLLRRITSVRPGFAAIQVDYF